MMILESVLRRLPERHRIALQWFAVNADTVQPWPDTLPDGTMLASKAKGIYKPSWTKYALSVRQSLGGTYPDREPVTHPDGTWSYLYFQENSEPAQRDSQYTNVGLMECFRDNVPVGVLRQVKRKPSPAYVVLGLALVSGWEEGYFFLEGFSKEGVAQERGPRPQLDAIIEDHLITETDTNAFQPDNIVDGRKHITASIVLRRGQNEFRQILLKAYSGKCAITGCSTEEVLEAAHIVPYLGPETNHPSNGLLLRADIHTLFDIGLIVVNSSTMTLVVSKELSDSTYQELQGKLLFVPEDKTNRPNLKALNYHRQWAGL